MEITQQHSDLSKLKSLKWKCSSPCKVLISDEFIKWAKKSLSQIMASPDVIGAEDPLMAFSEALLNFHSHHCQDVHSSKWCKYHPQEVDGKPYSTDKPMKCTEQEMPSYMYLLKETLKSHMNMLLQRAISLPTALRGFMALLSNIVGRDWIFIIVTICARQIMAICRKEWF